MIGIETVVWIVIYLLVAGLIFGLLYFLVNFIGTQVGGAAGALFIKFGKIVLVILAVLVLIGILLSLVGHPLVRFGP